MCIMDTIQVDAATTDTFANRMTDILNGGAIALMVSVGHRTGLFDTMAGLSAATCDEIAEAAGLNERYVREWLGAMVTGQVVYYDADSKTYTLPPAHADFLAREAAPNNMAAIAQFVPLLGCVEDQVVDCFRNGGGVPYSSFGRFQDVMAELSNQTVLAGLLDHILPLVPGLIDRLEEGIDVLDVGCGKGRALVTLAKHFPHSRFVGYDFSEEGVCSGRAEADSLGLTNIHFRVQDVSCFDDTAGFDLITAFDSIHDQAKPDRVLERIANALREGGTFLMQDIAGSSHVQNNLEHPIAPFLYTVSCMHCMTVSLAMGGAGLGAMWGQEKAEEMLEGAGFANVTVSELEHDIENVYYVCKT